MKKRIFIIKVLRYLSIILLLLIIMIIVIKKWHLINNKKIAEYRKQEQIKKTKELRPDLMEE